MKLFIMCIRISYMDPKHYWLLQVAADPPMLLYTPEGGKSHKMKRTQNPAGTPARDWVTAVVQAQYSRKVIPTNVKTSLIKVYTSMGLASELQTALGSSRCAQVAI